MKQVIITCAFLGVYLSSFAQVAISNNGALPDANTILDIKSNSKGVKFPRLTTTERKAMTLSVADAGLMVFDHELNSLFMYDGEAWIPFAYAKSQNPMVVAGPVNSVTSEAALGTSCDISGNYAVVGAKNDSVGTTGFQGAAYVFEKVNGQWLHRARLVALDGSYANYFGTSVAIEGDYIVVGAPKAKVGSTEPGAAYVFIRNGLSWTQQAKIYANNASGPFPDFGLSVDIAGASVIVGAPGQNVGVNSQQGSSYVFNRSGVAWTLVKEIQRLNGVALDYFGQSVSMKGDIAVIGTPYADVAGKTNVGAASVFLRSGNNFSLMSELTLPSGLANNHMGWSVSVDAGRIAVGIPNAGISNINTGWAALYKRQGNTWYFEDMVAPAHPVPMKFGTSVVLIGNLLLVGAPEEELGGFVQRGSVYLYDCSGTDPILKKRITDDNGFSKDLFGTGLASDGVSTVIGAPGANKITDVNNGKGKVYFGLIEINN